MNPQQRIRTLLALGAVALAGHPLARAQAVNTPAPAPSVTTEDEVITLSPFEVKDEDTEGYAAATSLAGNRLNSDLKDIGSAISVVTAQMMKDIGATSNESLLQYTTNTEVGNIYGNMANAGSGTQLQENYLANPNANTRVRGLASADNTVDYFMADMPWDSYNVDRVDFQRGPASFLFGNGSPAGIINAGTKTATFRERNQVEFKFSSFGSTRTTLDTNQVLIPKQLSLRLNVLKSRENFEQDPAYQNDRRLAGALRFEPAFLNKGSAHTTLRANFESGNITSNRPRSLTPGDAITPWFRTGTSTGYDAVGTVVPYNNLNHKGFDARGLQDTNIASIGLDGRGEQVKNYNNSGGLVSGALNPYWQPWLSGQLAAGYFGNVMATGNDNSSAIALANWEPATNRGIGTNGLIDKNIGGIPNSRMSSITIYRDISKKVNLPGAKFGLTRNLTLTDPTIFDFYHQLIDGPNKKEWQNFHRADLNLAQTFLNGDLGFELVYDKQHYENGSYSMMSDKGQQLYVDVIKTLADGTTNPNFGRPFIADGTGDNASSNSSDREASRITGYLRHDFTKQGNTLLNRILGQQTITGLYIGESKRSENRQWLRWATDQSYAQDFLANAPATPITIDDSRRTVYPVIYLGSSLAGSEYTSASGANIPNPKYAFSPSSGTVRAFDSTWNSTVNPADVWANPLYPATHKFNASTQSENPANYKGWVNTPVALLDAEKGDKDALTKWATLSKYAIESKAFNWQGSFYNNSIVGMYAYRRDTVRTWATTTGTRNAWNQVNLDPTIFKLTENPSSTITDSSSSYSLVTHLHQLFPRTLPFQVSLFYNKSNNFQPMSARVGPLSNPLDMPTGTTEDYGLRLATKDGKYSVKINKYKTNVKDANGTSGFNSFYLGQLFTDYQKARNKFKYELSGNTPDTYHVGDSGTWLYQPKSGQTADQAIAAMQTDVAGWDKFVSSLPQEFLTGWKFDFGQGALADAKNYTYQTPNGFSIPEDNVSRGYETELFAQPIKGLRLTANISKAEASRANIGDLAFNSLVTQINTALNTTAAGTLRGSSGSTATTALDAWNANFWASWLSVKGQEGAAVGEMRKWRANLIANYDFSRGFLKGINTGVGYRWQDKVVIGYKYLYNDPVPQKATTAVPDMSQPYYGPAETNVDAWVGYSHKLSKRLNWRTQLNVRNIGKHNSLIPITTQPDGTVAAWRIAPTMLWSLTNSLEF